MSVDREDMVEIVGEILLEELVEASDVENPEDFCQKVAQWLNAIQDFAEDRNAINDRSMLVIHNAMEMDEITEIFESKLTDEDSIDVENLDVYVDAFRVLKEMAVELNNIAPKTWVHPGAESAFSMRY